ncbi:MAG TPA: DNA-binding response regulator [Flavobacteriales bacterium]|nr:DNA-binding response regulator [Flavobacteriales bacterium]
MVVDDESVVREGIVAILSLQPGIEVVGEASDGIQAVELASKVSPDVVLLDMSMPNQDGLTTIPILIENLPNVRILVLTSFANSDKVYQSIKSGALGFLLKDARREQLIQAIHDVAHGQASISPSIAVKVIQEVNHPSEVMYTSSPLTGRELETLRLIARGMTNQEIADAITVTERTVAKYVSNILEKLHLANRTQAALYAIREGLTENKGRSKKTQ